MQTQLSLYEVTYITSFTMKKVTAIVIGAGQRGYSYSQYANDFPDKLQIVGVAEPRTFYRERLVKEYNLPDDNVFISWENVAAREKFADCVFVTTQDQMHKEPAIAFAKRGYHILLEKPMAITYNDCCQIVKVCEENKVILGVCHVLRYSPQARTIRRLIESGAIGDVVNIQHLEPVGFWHFAHSFVRGNWRNVAESTFSLLAKCCHDIDLIEYWMGAKKCLAISSMGSLKHFTHENKPEKAADRCLDCTINDTCPYSATRIYLDLVKQGYKGFPVNVISPVLDIESVTDVLKTGPYGRCVYDCDNDVMDNQVVLMQYEGGASCTLSMVAFTEKICARQTRVFGTKGELTCDFDTTIVRQFDFVKGDVVIHDTKDDIRSASNSRLQTHGGADFFAMKAFVDAVSMNEPNLILTGPKESLQSHYLCFVAEKARIEKCVLDLNDHFTVD
ncbi:hypothetical protein LSH36_495g02004 [Paralvinella palmiformis]|uniref:Uncharacterized protein n=1 Tax=Paralvinella palmiformis TaxID=53620 RepID=A0AAD9MWY0_9ANNE|nr:hypothetical protein LSH36_495g02004 [Paralvinella palmiformis]